MENNKKIYNLYETKTKNWKNNTKLYIQLLHNMQCYFSFYAKGTNDDKLIWNFHCPFLAGMLVFLWAKGSPRFKFSWSLVQVARAGKPAERTATQRWKSVIERWPRRLRKLLWSGFHPQYFGWICRWMDTSLCALDGTLNAWRSRPKLESDLVRDSHTNNLSRSDHHQYSEFLQALAVGTRITEGSQSCRTPHHLARISLMSLHGWSTWLKCTRLNFNLLGVDPNLLRVCAMGLAISTWQPGQRARIVATTTSLWKQHRSGTHSP